MKTIGVIGGLGPKTTAEFYMEIIRRSRPIYPEAYPTVVIYSVPVPFEVERGFVQEGKGDAHRMVALLSQAVRQLEKGGAELLVLPCNTVHMFYEQLNAEASVPFLNILDESARTCRNRGWRKVGILATKQTMQSALYDRALQKIGIEALQPPETQKNQVSQLIYRILSEQSLIDDRKMLLQMIEELRNAGADGVILGCTDLQLMVREGDSDLPIPAMDSMRNLADAAVREIAS